MTIRLFALILSIFPWVSSYAGEILKSITFEDKGSRVEVKANFGANVDYIKHFPMTRGKIIQIQIQVDNKVFSEENQKRRETLEPSDTKLVALRDAIYEGNVRGGPYLVFRFDQVVSFELGREKNSRVITVMVEKENQLAQTEAPAATTPPAGATLPPAVTAAKGASDAEAKLIAGRQALTRGDNNEAILRFSEIVEMPPNDYAQDAKEYLGLSRERNGQLDMARKEYEEYLKTYDKSPKANVVRQRLMTLIARIEDTERRLKEAKRAQTQVATQANDNNPNTFGRVSMLYYGAANKSPSADRFSRTDNRVLTYLDVTSRKRTEFQEMRIVFSGSDDTDFMAPSSTGANANEKEQHTTKIRSLFMDFKNKQKGLFFTGGRQSINSGGVLGRVDGLLGGYEFKPNLRVFGVVGLPVDFQEFDKVQTNRPVYGARVDVDDVIKDLKSTVYGIEQRIGGFGGVLDRRAVGGDLRFFRKETMLYGLIDYDVSYRAINFMTGHVGWQLNEATKFDLHLDDRKSPVLLTSNALSGIVSGTSGTSGTTSNELGISQLELDELKKDLTIDNAVKIIPAEKLRELAQNNTGGSRLVTFGVTQTVTKNVDFYGTLTYSMYKSSPAQVAQARQTENSTMPTNPNFGDPSQVDVTDNYSAAGQVMRRNWFLERDIYVLGFRVSWEKKQKQASLNFTGRRPVGDKWTVDGRGRAMYILGANGPETRLTPTLHVDFRYNRDVTVEFEVSSDFATASATVSDNTSVYTYGNGGFRYVF